MIGTKNNFLRFFLENKTERENKKLSLSEDDVSTKAVIREKKLTNWRNKSSSLCSEGARSSVVDR